MHCINKDFCLRRRSKLVDTVSKVADMAAGIAGSGKKFCHPLPELLFRQQQGRGIKVPLHRDIRPNLFNRLGNINPPVKAKDICTGCFGEIQ
jgi:hypothetical protein